LKKSEVSEEGITIPITSSYSYHKP